MSDLTDADHAVLLLAGRSPLPHGVMVNAIRDLGFPSDVVYYQRLNELLDTQSAEAAYPGLVHRLRRLRSARSAARRPVGSLEGAVPE